VLARGNGHGSRLARPGRALAGDALRWMARRAERHLSPRWAALLVAGAPAVAGPRPLAGVDGPPLPPAGHAALRRALGLPRLLRAAGLCRGARSRTHRAAPRRPATGGA
jgi:hypothetical protein